MNKLIEFLKEEKVYDAFIGNYNRLADADIEPSIDEFLEYEQGDSSAIASAFIWSETEQGTEFWGEIDVKWVKYERNN